MCVNIQFYIDPGGTGGQKIADHVDRGAIHRFSVV